MAKLKIKKGDKVVVIAGKDKGKQGEVLKVFPVENRAIVSGVYSSSPERPLRTSFPISPEVGSHVNQTRVSFP